MGKYVTDYQLVHLEADFAKRRPDLIRLMKTRFKFHASRRESLTGTAIAECWAYLREAFSEGKVYNRKAGWRWMRNCLWQAVHRLEVETPHDEPSNYTLADLRAEFSTRYPDLVNQAHAQLGTNSRIKRIEFIETALPLCWHYARRYFLNGKIIDTATAREYLGIALWYSCRHVVRGQTLENTVRPDGEFKHKAKRDVFDPSSPMVRRPDKPVEYETTPPDQVDHEAQVRIDLSEFLDTLSDRQRLVCQAMLQGCKTSEIARIFRVGEGQIRMFREEIREAFERHFGD